MCTRDYLHAFSGDSLEELPCIKQYYLEDEMNVLWEADADITNNRDSAVYPPITDKKVTCTRLKTIKIVPFTDFTPQQWIFCALLCLEKTSVKSKDLTRFSEWSENYLKGTDRTLKTAKEILKELDISELSKIRALSAVICLNEKGPKRVASYCNPEMMFYSSYTREIIKEALAIK